MRKMHDNIRLYHVDHLGSTSLVTDIDGEITQYVAYIPYGEIFVEQRNGSWNTPYLFNAKELDEETGLYYYGARYLDPTHAAWLSVDPLFEKYVGMTPYNYCAGNPVKLVDVDGREEKSFRKKVYETTTGETAGQINNNVGAVVSSPHNKMEAKINQRYNDTYDQKLKENLSKTPTTSKGRTSEIGAKNAINDAQSHAGVVRTEYLRNAKYSKLANASKGLGTASNIYSVGVATVVTANETFIEDHTTEQQFIESSMKVGEKWGSALGSWIGGSFGGTIGAAAGGGTPASIPLAIGGGAFGAYVGDQVGSYLGEELGRGIGKLISIFKY